MHTKRKSDWTYDTGYSVGIGYGFVGAGHGSVYLVSPGKSKVVLRYLSAGIGPSEGLKIPQPPKLPKQVTVGFGPKSFPSEGQIFVLDGFGGYELAQKDLTGFCTIQEIVIPPFNTDALPASRSFTVMFLGIEQSDLIQELAVEGITFSAFGLVLSLFREGFNWSSFLGSYAKALLLMKSRGISSFVGAMGSLGYIWDPAVPYTGPGHLANQHPQGDEPTTMRSSDVAQEDYDADALFTFDRSFIRPDAQIVLTKMGQTVRKYSGHKIEIRGHTDAIGGLAYNKELSLRRANAVKQWLVSHGDVKAENVITTGYGKSSPKDTNATKEGRQRNRRVEIIVKWT